MLCIFFPLVKCVSDSYNEVISTLKMKIAKLHVLTNFSTFYEFFNLNENCSDSDIKKAFRKMKKSTAPKGIDKSQFDELVMYGYSLLVNYRKAYDSFLRDSKFLYLDEPVNYKNYAIVIVLALIFFFLFIDFIFYALKYLSYLERKGEEKKKNEQPPMMLTNKFYKSVESLMQKQAKN